MRTTETSVCLIWLPLLYIGLVWKQWPCRAAPHGQLGPLVRAIVSNIFGPFFQTKHLWLYVVHICPMFQVLTNPSIHHIVNPLHLQALFINAHRPHGNRCLLLAGNLPKENTAWVLNYLTLGCALNFLQKIYIYQFNQWLKVQLYATCFMNWASGLANDWWRTENSLVFNLFELWKRANLFIWRIRY